MKKLLACLVFGAAVALGSPGCSVIGWTAATVTGYEGETKECPCCHERMPAHDHTCPHCGAILE